MCFNWQRWCFSQKLNSAVVSPLLDTARMVWCFNSERRRLVDVVEKDST